VAGKTAELKRALDVAQSTLTDAKMSLTGGMATICAILYQEVSYMDWVGYYCLRGVGGAAQELEIGPYQGHLACLRIKLGSGVCGAAAKRRQPIIVDNVRDFPGYIACSVSTQSEIVVPLCLNDELLAVLDVDSDELNAFDQQDLVCLTELNRLLDRCA
jgi:GAF domain-containing protein